MKNRVPTSAVELSTKESVYTFPSKQESSGSSLIIWFRHHYTKEIFILVGKETNYVEDNPGYCDALAKQGLSIHAFQENKTRNIPFFEHTAKTIGDVLKMEVRYDTPVYNPSKHVWNVHYRHLHGCKFRKGIIKGGKIQQNELPWQTVKRECCEEFCKIPDFRTTYVGVAADYSVFFHQIFHPWQISWFMKQMDSLKTQRYGELWDLSFVSLQDVWKDRYSYNRKTVEAIALFYRKCLVEYPFCKIEL